jgi:hypothetical protein
MASNSKKGPEKKGTSAQKPQAIKKELSENELVRGLRFSGS